MDQQDVTVYLLAPSSSTPSFYAQWVEPGSTRRRTRSLRTGDPDLAEKARGELEYEINHGLHAPPGRLSWEGFVERHAQEKLPGLRPATRVIVQQVLREFALASRPRNLADVDERMVGVYLSSLRARGLKPVTQRKLLGHLKATLRWGADQKLRGPAPRFERIKVPKKKQIRTVAPPVWESLLKALSAEWALFARVAWYTGMRVGELFLLRWDRTDGGIWLDLHRARAFISAEACKGGADRWVPLHPELVALLQPMSRASGQVFALAPNAGELSHRFCRLCRKLGFDVKTHDLRRTFASRYAPLVPAPVLKQLLGHADIRTTLEYYTDVDGALDDAIRKA